MMVRRIACFQPHLHDQLRTVARDGGRRQVWLNDWLALAEAATYPIMIAFDGAESQ